MTTTPGVFGRATAYQAPARREDQNAGIDPLAAIRRHVQAVLLQGGVGSGATSAVLNVVSSRACLIADQMPAVSGGPVCVNIPDIIDRIQFLSCLTLEEIAHLMSVSRRTIHNWKNGEAISSGNEGRLRDLDQAIRRIANTDAETARTRLMSRADGDVRPYDLLAESRFDIAIAMANGTAPIASSDPDRDEINPMLAGRLDPIAQIDPIGSPTLLSRRLRSSRR